MRSTLAGALALAAATAGAGAPAPAADGEAFTFVAMGDMPYRLPEDYARFERLIAATNEIGPAFTIHVGDTKSGGTSCGDAILEKVRAFFDDFEHALIYTPGDNEWTDCHREWMGAWDPLERLAKVRRMHFAEARSLGQEPIALERQSDVSKHAQMVENARWATNGVRFATVHVVGSNNGFEPRSLASVEEFFARDAANVDWITSTAKMAAEEDAAALVYAIHAELMFDTPTAYGNANAGFHATLEALREAAATFKKPILLIHGDSHEFVIDRPLTDADGETIENLTRLEVFGASDVHAVRVTVDPQDPAVFGFLPLIVPENVAPATE